MVAVAAAAEEIAEAETAAMTADAEDATNDSLKTEYKLKAYFKQNITPCLTLLWQGVIFLEKYTLIS